MENDFSVEGWKFRRKWNFSKASNLQLTVEILFFFSVKLKRKIQSRDENFGKSWNFPRDSHFNFAEEMWKCVKIRSF